MADTWTAIDFETANQDRGSACAVGLVRVVDGRPVERHSTLIRPPDPVRHFSHHNVAVHGITAADVAHAPAWDAVWRRILDFADGGALVAHNAPFDMGVVRRACAHTGLGHPAIDYACTLALSRRTWRALADHRLPTVCAHIGHRVTRHHRADADAEAAARIMIAAMSEHGTTSLAELSRAAGLRLGRLDAVTAPTPVAAPSPVGPAADRFDHWRRAAETPMPQACPDADPSGPLFGRTVCLSGDLAAMDKPEAWRRVAEAGGHPARNVTRTTDVLVVGSHAGVGKTAKHRRAETYRERGQRIDIITEAELLSRLGMTGA
ncbi:DNA polymerase III [Nocardiopsis sp. CNR-923]|uniref:exonuclease domain-containing protein n=1 Tax=Nocardiopsis sp. CNR-923 TaxID=1904965 RepID=UPI00095F02B8|nr:exonuclease domain-containing protein [Nocardiopsis sp. CNR-923]OLT25365.1 DNA polymerase III [Nocardiopsis sp. CNR-923]